MVSTPVKKELQTKHLVLLLPLLSVVLLEISGVAARQLEEYRFYDYANPVYVFVVLLGIVAVAVGGCSLIWLSRMAENELNKK